MRLKYLNKDLLIVILLLHVKSSKKIIQRLITRDMDTRSRNSREQEWHDGAPIPDYLSDQRIKL